MAIHPQLEGEFWGPTVLHDPLLIALMSSSVSLGGPAAGREHKNSLYCFQRGTFQAGPGETRLRVRQVHL